MCGAVTVSFHICLSLLHSLPEKECQFVFILGFILNIFTCINSVTGPYLKLCHITTQPMLHEIRAIIATTRNFTYFLFKYKQALGFIIE